MTRRERERSREGSCEQGTGSYSAHVWLGGAPMLFLAPFSDRDAALHAK